jgi:hypothetical protein
MSVRECAGLFPGIVTQHVTAPRGDQKLKINIQAFEHPTTQQQHTDGNVGPSWSACERFMDDEYAGRLLQEPANPLAGHYFECVSETACLLRSEKQELLGKIVPVLLLTTCCKTDARFEEGVARAFGGSTAVCREFVFAYREDLRASLMDTRTRPGCFAEVVSFCWEVREMVQERNALRGRHMQAQLGIPAYVSPRAKKRLCVLMCVSDSGALESVLRSHMLVRGERCTQGWLDVSAFRPSVGEWEDLMSCLPGTVEANKLLDGQGTHIDFQNRVYTGDGRKVVNTRSGEVLAQLFTFLLPAGVWQRMWVEMRFPLCVDIADRLIAMKERGWQPDMQQLLTLMLANPAAGLRKPSARRHV